jgi:hypothetical protein
LHAQGSAARAPRHTAEITPKTVTVFDISFVLFAIKPIGFQEKLRLAGNL